MRILLYLAMISAANVSRAGGLHQHRRSDMSSRSDSYECSLSGSQLSSSSAQSSRPSSSSTSASRYCFQRNGLAESWIKKYSYIYAQKFNGKQWKQQGPFQSHVRSCVLLKMYYVKNRSATVIIFPLKKCTGCIFKI